MKVLTEEALTYRLNWAKDPAMIGFILGLLNECQEIDTLEKEPDLIAAAEKYAEAYEDDDRQDIRHDVINAFFRGSEWQKRNGDK